MDEACHLSPMRMRSKPPKAFSLIIIFNERRSIPNSFRETRECPINPVIDDSYFSGLLVIPVTKGIKVEKMLELRDRLRRSKVISSCLR